MNRFVSQRRNEQLTVTNIASLMLAIVPLWLVMTAVVPANGQTSGSAPSPGDWTQFLTDNMQRSNPFETALRVDNVGSLRLKWKNPIASVLTLSPSSSPAVANGIVYFGSTDGNVYALNASTGAKSWSSDIGTQGTSSPAVANGVVYIGSNSGVFALNASTGAKLWSYATGSAVPSSPAVGNGVVYVGIEDPNSTNNNFFALNAGTGALLWSFSGVGPPTSFSSPAVANGVVYVGAADELDRTYVLYARNAKTGAPLWNFQSGNFFSAPVVANGIVYICSQDLNVYALNAATGVKLWSYKTITGLESSPAVANGLVYFGDDEGRVTALNAGTGAVMWSYLTHGAVTSSPAVANNVVYAASGDGILHALNATTGVGLWSYTTGSPISSPAIANGTLYIHAGTFADAGGGVYAFSVGADLFLRVQPSTTTVHQGDLLTYTFPVWNLGPENAVHEALNTQVPAGTTFNYIRISGTPGLGTCTTPKYLGTGQIVCHENASMAPNTTWTVRLTVRVTAPSGTIITANAATLADTPDPNPANNTATVSIKVQ